MVVLQKITRALAAAVLWGCFASQIHAQVLWEDYQGNYRVTGTDTSVTQDKPGPSYVNGPVSATNTDAVLLNNLRSISGNLANATRTGSSPNIDYSIASRTLCNTDVGYDRAGTGAACLADAQGRVLYALLKFPYAGDYTFEISHDDQTDVDLSTSYQSTNYRNISYNLPVGSLPAYTTGENNFDTINDSAGNAATFNAASDNSCAHVRIYWNNVGGVNFLRLQWTRPDQFGGAVTEIIPATYFLDPSSPLSGSNTNCSGSVTATGTNTSIVVNKVVGATGRAASLDQFTVSIASPTATVVSATTAGGTTGQSASTGAQLVTANTQYTIGDAMATGSTATMASYTQTIGCTRNGTAFTPGGTAGAWTVTPASNNKIICNVTNTRKTATLRLRKSWVGATVNDSAVIPATTGLTNNTAQLSATANTATEIDNGTAVTVYVGETANLSGETLTSATPANYQKRLTCSNATPSGNDATASNTVPIPLTGGGTAIVCTYTNTWAPPLTITKTAATYSDPLNGTTNPKRLPGALVDYTITVTSPARFTMDAGTVFLTDKLPADVTMFVGDLGAAGAGPVTVTPGSSGITYTYSALGNNTDSLEFSNDAGATWTYVPSPDANGFDAGVTAIRIKGGGTMAASTSFTAKLRARIK